MWFKDVIMLNWDFIWKQTIGIFVQEMYMPLVEVLNIKFNKHWQSNVLKVFYSGLLAEKKNEMTWHEFQAFLHE